MKKRILCLVLALLLVGSAVGFFVYDKVGNTFNYAKNPGKYVTIDGTDYVKALYTGGKTEPEAVKDTDLQAAVAKALASLQKDGTIGVVQMYDTLYVKYDATTEVDGKVVNVNKAETLDPTKSTSVQLGADSDLARLFVEFLLGKDVSKTAYRTYTKGNVYTGDKIVFDYTVDGAGGDGRKNLDRRIEGTAFLDNIEDGAAGLTALFLEKMNNDEVNLGEALTLELGEGEGKKTFVITIRYALRDKIVGGKVQDGDLVCFRLIPITVEDEKDVEGKETSHSGILRDKLDLETELTGLYAALKELEIGKKTEEKFTVTDKDGNTVTYKAIIDYVDGGRVVKVGDGEGELKADQVELAESYIEFTKTYPDDSEAKADNDETLELKGKEVKYRVAVTGVKTYAYSFANITDATNGLKYTAETDSALEKLFKAYDAYLEAKEQFDEASETDLSELTTKLNEAKDALYDAEIAYIDTLNPEDGSKLKAYYNAVKALADAKKALADAEKLEGDEAKTEAELEELKSAVTTAEAAVNTALDEYAKDEDIYLDDVTYVDIAARKAYEKQETETLEDANKDKLAYEIAKEVWNKLLEDAAKNVKYPSKAVRVAYRGLVDGYKTNYYENRDKAPYKDYSTFKSYLKNSAYAGKDYKAELTEEAKAIVLEQLVLYRLVEMYDVTLTEGQESILNLYQQIGATSYIDTMRTGYLFDNLMQKIAEEICPAVAKD